MAVAFWALWVALQDQDILLGCSNIKEIVAKTSVVFHESL
jgi:hypothetical protein